jgi:ABC-type branched-subunit amino acid transport system substrate-binding protein
MPNRRRFLAGAAALYAAGQSNFAGAADKPPVRIGCLQPMTGFAADYGALYNAALTLAMNDVNAAGGINGSRLELRVEDDQFSAQQAVLLFRKHVADGMFAVLGPIGGTSWENAAPIAAAMRCPAINANALKPGISRKPYALRIHPPDDSMIPEGMAEFCKAHLGVRKVVIAGDVQEASGAAGMGEFAKAAARQGLEVIDRVSYQTRTTDFSPMAIKVRGLNPDALLVSSLGPTSLGFVKELETQRFDKPILINALVWAGNAFINSVGTAGRNLYTLGMTTDQPGQGNPAHDAFAPRYLKFAAETTRLARPINICNVSVTYDSVMLICDLMRQAKIDGTTEPAAARSALIERLGALTSWKGINEITMRASGDGHIQTHLLRANIQAKTWEFALPPAERINTPFIPA